MQNSATKYRPGVFFWSALILAAGYFVFWTNYQPPAPNVNQTLKQLSANSGTLQRPALPTIMGVVGWVLVGTSVTVLLALEFHSMRPKQPSMQKEVETGEKK